MKLLGAHSPPGQVTSVVLLHFPLYFKVNVFLSTLAAELLAKSLAVFGATDGFAKLSAHDNLQLWSSQRA
jgi:hypothetical protein